MRPLPLLPFNALTAVAALAGGQASQEARSRWYERLRKPPFQPPPWIFGPVWSLLYALSARSGARVFASRKSTARTKALALWGTQLVLNGAWSPLFFGRHRLRAALVDCAALLGVSAAYIRVARRVDRTAAWLFVPYVGWVAFATVLNAEIVRRNPPAMADRSEAPESTSTTPGRSIPRPPAGA